MNNPQTEIIIDSQVPLAQILAQNPNNPAPAEVLDEIVVLEVKHYGYDGLPHAGQIAVNKAVADDVRQFFEKAWELQFPIEKVIPISNPKYAWDDNASCDDNNSSGYNYRLIGGTNRMSKHARGLAFDINPVPNIYVRFDENMKETFRAPKNGVYDENAKGTLTKDHPLVKLMKDLGWTWGGDWTSPLDYQHFEKNI